MGNDETTPELEAAAETDPLEIADLLTEVVRALVDHPQFVKVEEHGEGTNSSLLMITVEPTDVGKVLGKQGATIKALRDLFSRIAAVDGRRSVIEVVDPRRLATTSRK